MENKAPIVMGCLVVGGVFGLLAVGGVFAAYTALAGSAEIVILNNREFPMVVKVDGTIVEDVGPNEIARVPIAQGSHVVTTEADYPVDVNGFSVVLVPTGPEQCFAKVDVSHLYEGAPRTNPLVKDSWAGSKAISEHDEFHSSALHDEIDADYVPTMIVPLPCSEVAPESAQAFVETNQDALF